jgi:transposase
MKENTKYYLCIKQQMKRLTKEEYLTLRELCHAAKNLYNEGLYNIRQHFFETEKYLSYPQNYHDLKSSDNYRKLNSNMAQQILKEVDSSFKSFFGLLKKAKAGKYEYKDIHLPKYLPKDVNVNIKMYKRECGQNPGPIIVDSRRNYIRIRRSKESSFILPFTLTCTYSFAITFFCQDFS